MTFHIIEYTMWFFMIGFFHSMQSFQGSSCCSRYQYFIPFYGWIVVPLCIYHNLSVHQLMDICVVYTFWILWMLLLWTLMYKYLFESLLSVLLSIYSEMELLDHVVTLYLIFLGTTMFSTVAAQFYIATSSTWGSSFSISSPTLSFLKKFYVFLIVFFFKRDRQTLICSSTYL